MNTFKLTDREWEFLFRLYAQPEIIPARRTLFIQGLLKKGMLKGTSKHPTLKTRRYAISAKGIMVVEKRIKQIRNTIQECERWLTLAGIASDDHIDRDVKKVEG